MQQYDPFISRDATENQKLKKKETKKQGTRNPVLWEFAGLSTTSEVILVMFHET